MWTLYDMTYKYWNFRDQFSSDNDTNVGKFCPQIQLQMNICLLNYEPDVTSFTHTKGSIRIYVENDWSSGP